MIGRVFMGRYEAVRLLGEGGMGKVYLAHQLDLNRQVVIKIMHEHVAVDPVFRERFQRETMLMARFQHPNAVTLIDASLTEGPCIVMEYIKGINLDDLLERNGRFSPGRVARIVGQLCEVLQEAHQVGMIHRDLKPSNLMLVDSDSPKERLKVMDFGLAKLVESKTLTEIQEKPITVSNYEFALGTPGYICPEQVKGEQMDHRGDIYSVGVIMYELLTGRLPFTGNSAMDLMIAHATEAPPAFADLGMAYKIPEVIEQVVFSCLEKDPANRPQSAADLAERYETAVAIIESGMETRLHAQLPPEAILAQKAMAAFPQDDRAFTFLIEAWMPETIALLKLKGFAHDTGGTILESVPGLIRLQINPEEKARTGWSFFRKSIDPLYIELHLQHGDMSKGPNHLLIQVVFRPAYQNQLHDTAWRTRCSLAFVELRSYLMGV